MTTIWVRSYIPGEIAPIPTYRECADVLEAIEIARKYAPAEVLSVADGQDPEQGAVVWSTGGE